MVNLERSPDSGAAKQRSARMRFRFSVPLWFLLAVIALSAGWLGWVCNSAGDERRALRVMRSGDAKVEFEDELTPSANRFDEDPFPWGEFANPIHKPGWLERRLGSEYFRRIAAVHYYGKDMAEPGMPIPLQSPSESGFWKSLLRLRGLSRLSLRFAKLEPRDAAAICELRNLEHLRLDRCEIEGDFYARLSRLRGLKSLELDCMEPIPESDWLRFAQLTELRLRDLDLKSNPRLIASLRNLKNLEFLGVSSSNLHGIDLAPLNRLRSLKHLRLAATSCTDADLEPIDFLNRLEGLDLSNNPQLTGKTFSRLAQARNLRVLQIASDAFERDGLTAIRGLRMLVSLKLREVSITSKDLAEIGLPRSLKRLALLDLDGTIGDGAAPAIGEISGLEELATVFCPITDSGLAQLGGLTKLKRLNLHYVPFASSSRVGGSIRNLAGVDLSRWQHLERLDLHNSELNDQGLSRISELKSLRHLDLSSTKITDAGLACLSGLPNLETLDLDGCSISDLGLKALAGIRSLQRLRLSAFYLDRITSAGIEELRELRPELVVECEGLP